jgi:hypothetical protein
MIGQLMMIIMELRVDGSRAGIGWVSEEVGSTYVDGSKTHQRH